MKMYFYILKLMFYCWRHYIKMDIDDRPKTYYILTFKMKKVNNFGNNINLLDSHAMHPSSVQGSCIINKMIRVAVSKKPAREPYVIYNKLKRTLFQKMIKNKKINRHVTHFLGFKMEAYC